MTTLLEATRNRILADATLLSTLGDRLRPEKAAQSDSVPYGILTVIGGTPEGYLGGDAGIEHALIQVDVYSATETQATTITRLIQNQLVGYRGVIGTVTITGIGRSGTMRSVGVDSIDGSDDGVYGKSQDYLISHRY
jgi:hypothetical protein